MADQSFIWSLSIGVLGYIGSRIVEVGVKAVAAKNSRRDQKHELSVSRLESVVFEVRDLASEYWLSGNVDGSEKPAEGAIVGRIFYLTQQISSLFDGSPRLCSAVELELARFDEACTGGNFGSLKRREEPMRCRDIELTAYSLVHRLSLCAGKLPSGWIR